MAHGHTGWAEHGEDIVCAAASAVLQAAWYGLTEVAGVEVVARRDAGYLEVAWPAAVRERADVHAIVKTAELAVVQIARQYPAHVRVVHEDEPDPKNPVS